MRGHLEDAARDLQMAGLSPCESEREAVRRFGAPDEVAGAPGPRRASAAAAAPGVGRAGS